MGNPRRVRHALTFAGFASLGLLSYLQTSAFANWIGRQTSLDVSKSAEPIALASDGSDVQQSIVPSIQSAEKRSGTPRTAPSGNDSARAPVAHPKTARECIGTGRLAIILAGHDQQASVAVVVPQDGSPVRRLQAGADYEGSKVWHIGTDRIWLYADGRPCQMRMYEPAEPAPTRGERAPDRVAGVKGDVQKVGTNEYRVDRSLLDKLIQNPGDLLRVRAIPEQEGGRAAGLKLKGIKPDTLLATLGLQDGDRLEAINGMSMADPTEAMGAFARLRYEKHLVVTVRRGGKEVNIDVSVV